MQADPSFVPVSMIRIPAPMNGEFDWKDAFSRILVEFNEVLIRRKVIRAPILELDGEVISHTKGLGKAELRRCVKTCINQRRTSLLIIDEANHFLIAKSRSFFLQQFELLKSLCDDFGITLLLSGSYELLAIQEFNGQLIRRTEVIHYKRYSRNEVLDGQSKVGESFRNLVFTLLEKMPVKKERDFQINMDYFYMRSLGSTGLLSKWLQKAFEMTLDSPDGVLTQEILESSHRSNKELEVIEKECQLGEFRMQDSSPVDLARLLGFDYLPSLDSTQERTRIPKLPEMADVAPKRTLPSRSSRVGTRMPSRDKAEVQA
jgi:hypothetical protein